MRKAAPLVIAAVVVASGVWWLARVTTPPLPGPPPSSLIAAVSPPASVEARGLPTLAPMLRRVMPAVVAITVQARAPAEDNPLYKDPFFRRFFGDKAPAERQVLAAGSGVIINADGGLVVTNAHVVKDAQRIGVGLADGRRVEAKLVGADPSTDLALVSISAPSLTAMALEDSDVLQIGDCVVAIGNPFGLGQTATFGLISAMGRSGLGIEGYEDFIQTDAAVNPGNSGGALVDIDGHLIGINTAIVAPAEGNVGIGFAIPSDMVRYVADQLAQFGKVTRGRLGVSVQDHPGAMPASLQGEGPPGAMVADVARGSAAEQAGLRSGDIIVAIDGRPIVSASQLRARVGLKPVGQPIEIEILRDGNCVKLTAQITIAAPDPPETKSGQALTGARELNG
jgi:Do/DeqQ family serine protease